LLINEYDLSFFGFKYELITDEKAAAQAQRAAYQSSQQPLANGIQGRNVAVVSGNGSSPIAGSSLPNGHPQPGVPTQARSHPPLQALPNSAQANGGLGVNLVGIKGITQGPLPGASPGQSRVSSQLSPENMRIYLEASRVQQEQQRFLQQQRQAQQFGAQAQNNGQPGPHSSPNMGSMNGSLNNATMAGTIPAGGNMGSPSMNTATMANGTSVSPRAGQSRPLSNGVVPAIHQISSSLQARNPHLSPEQIQKMTTDRLSQYQHSMSQAAMNAAAGNSAASAANFGLPNHDGNLQPLSQPPGMTGMHNTQAQAAYAQMLRTQQQNQHRAVAAGAAMANGTVPNGRQASRSATPQMQRSGSVQAAPGAGKSPRPPQAQISS
jgi:chromatin modification-related protein VID21